MNQNFQASEAVKNVMDQYFQAVYQGDIATLKELFHPKASMNGFLGQDLLIGTPEAFFAVLQSKPSMASQNTDCRCVLKSLQVTGKIASVVLFVDGFFGAATIEDHFHLLEVDGKWRILCKTFTTL